MARRKHAACFSENRLNETHRFHGHSLYLSIYSALYLLFYLFLTPTPVTTPRCESLSRKKRHALTVEPAIYEDDEDAEMYSSSGTCLLLVSVHRHIHYMHYRFCFARYLNLSLCHLFVLTLLSLFVCVFFK